MPSKTNDERREQFEDFNPYVQRTGHAAENAAIETQAVVLGLLAVAYEIKQVGAAVRFGNK